MINQGLAKNILKRINGRIKFRNVLSEYNKEMARLHRPSRKESNGHDCLTFSCMFCDFPSNLTGKANRASEQIVASYAKKVTKIVPVSWMWICQDCKKELLKIKAEGKEENAR